jgi:hypothetical protein
MSAASKNRPALIAGRFRVDLTYPKKTAGSILKMPV